MTQRSAAMGAQSAPARGLRDIDLRGQRQVIPLTLVAALGVGAIWLVDISSGPEYGFAIFYLIPIGIASWWLGRRPAIATAIVSGAAWISADIISRTATSVPASIWNGITRTVIFLVLAVLLAQVR